MNENLTEFHCIHTTYTHSWRYSGNESSNNSSDKENTIQVSSQKTSGSHISNGRSITIYIDSVICCTFSYILCCLSTTWVFLMTMECLNWVKWARDCLQCAGQRSPPYKLICPPPTDPMWFLELYYPTQFSFWWDLTTRQPLNTTKIHTLFLSVPK